MSAKKMKVDYSYLKQQFADSGPILKAMKDQLKDASLHSGLR